MYRFVDLTEEGHHLRRQRLDWYGQLAQVSAIVPLFAIQVFFLALWLRRKLNPKDGFEQAPGSPYAKPFHVQQRFNSEEVARKWRTFLWWCGDSAHLAGLDLGTRGELLGAVVWTAWLVSLSFAQTGDDYLHLTKRFGAVASSQLPFHYLLSFKSPYSPLQLLTRRSHESLISLHQILGRIMTILLYTHAALYLNFYAQKSLLAEKLLQFYVLCGVFAVITFTVIATTALKPVRNWSYRVFYIVHVTLATLLLPTLYFHVHHVRIYVYETLAVYILHAGLRFFAATTHTTGTITQVTGTDLVAITIPINGKDSIWQTGQHAYISLKGHPLLRTFRSNPFTVASIPVTDGHLKFVARILNGNTAKLARSQEQAQPISIEGPYGLKTHAEALLSYDRVLFLAGGIGATFIVPLYRQLLSDLSPGKGSHRRQKVSFLWVARSMNDVQWALLADEREREGFTERLRVYLTRDVEGIAADSSNQFATGVAEEDEGPGEDGIEMEEQKTLLRAEKEESAGRSGVDINIRAGRPDLTMAVEQIFSHGGKERVAVIVCGPSSLSRSLRGHIEPWIRKGRDVWFWEEAFGL